MAGVAMAIRITGAASAFGILYGGAGQTVTSFITFEIAESGGAAPELTATATLLFKLEKS